MKDFDVYTEVPIDQCSQEDIDQAIGVRWVKRWKTDTELRMRLVVQGCYQDSSSIDVDSIYASTPSLVTLRLRPLRTLCTSGPLQNTIHKQIAFGDSNVRCMVFVRVLNCGKTISRRRWNDWGFAGANLTATSIATNHVHCTFSPTWMIFSLLVTQI